MKRAVKKVCLTMALMTSYAQAEEAIQSAYTWDALGSIAGATAATLMIVQLIKAPIDKLWHIPTRLLVYVVAWTLLILSQNFSGGLTWESTLLAAVNAVMVALSAYGSYEVIFSKKTT